MAAIDTIKRCVSCGSEFIPDHGNERYCSNQCRGDELSERIRKDKRSCPKPRTIQMKSITRASLAIGRLLYSPVKWARKPRTRGECAEDERPCPWVSCKHHLYLDVNPRTGSIKFNFPSIEPWELEESCALDAADRFAGRGLGDDERPGRLYEVGDLMNLRRERIRQIEIDALERFEIEARRRGLVD